MEQLVGAAQKGNRRAKEELLERFKPLLIKNIIKFFGSTQEFEDWLQEGQIVILQSIKNYNWDLGVPFAAFVQKQVFYFYINERKKVKEEVILDQPIGEGNIRKIDLISDETACIEDIFIKTENNKDLIYTINTLSKKQREVVIAYYIENKKLKNLAKEKGVCYQSLIKLKARALENIKSTMG